jgi:hypothetical protein
MFVVSFPQLGAPMLQVVGLRSARILTIPLSGDLRLARTFRKDGLLCLASHASGATAQ